MGVSAIQDDAGLGAGHKESAVAMKAMQTLEVQIGAAHDVESTGFRGDLVQQVDVMTFSIGTSMKSGD